MKESRRKEYFAIKYCFTGEDNKIKLALDSYSQNNTDLSDVNRILELYNIKKFFDKYECVKGWSEEEYKQYKSKVEKADNEVKQFFLGITEETLVPIHEVCDVMFWDDFWTFFYMYRVYEKIPVNRFKEIIDGLKMSPNTLLKNRGFVEEFDAEIAELLKEPDFGARFIVDYYLRKSDRKEKYFLPKSLSKEDKYNVVKDYINGDIVNANVLDLIINGKSNNTKEFVADDKLRHLAKKRYEKYWQDNTVPMIKHETGVNVSFAPDNPEIELEFANGIISAKYNSNWIKENLDYSTLMNNFIYLFAYVDTYMRCSLTAGSLKQGIFESLFSTNGNGMYQRGQSFELLNGLANAQMHGYVNVLDGFDVHIEEIIKWFFEEYLKEEFEAEGFACVIPAITDSILSKYERMATIMDGATKQFKLFVEEGEIDREYYEMISGSVRYKDIPSFIKNKYAYVNSSELQREMHDLFSDQSMLSYTEKTKDKHNTLFELLQTEVLKTDEIEVYNQDEFEWLRQRETILINDNKVILNYERSWVLYELYNKGVLCLQYRKSEEVRKLIKNGEIMVGSTLLSKPEWEYFNYVLNKSEFSNGLDLRNKYIHDGNSLNEKRQQHDYMVLLKMFVILIIKINEEFCLRDKMLKGETDFYEL